MKVVVDYDLCEANALCMEACPEVFRVEEDDTLTVLLDKLDLDALGAFLNQLGKRDTDITATSNDDFSGFDLFMTKSRHHTLKVICINNEINLVSDLQMIILIRNNWFVLPQYSEDLK